MKAVLLHNSNQLPSVPVAYANVLKETYSTMALLLEKINYKHHSWKICSDLKVVAILTGMQPGYTKHCCFICDWDSRDRAKHYEQREWGIRKRFVIGEKNIMNTQLVSPDNIILPALHLKLGIAKQFLKKLDRSSEAFKILRDFFPEVSEGRYV